MKSINTKKKSVLNDKTLELHWDERNFKNACFHI